MELQVVKGDGWHFLSRWWVVVRRKETAKDRKVELCQVLSQLMTFSPTVTVLNVSIIPYITWPPCLGRFSPSPHLTSFHGSMNGHFSVELSPSPAHCVLEVSVANTTSKRQRCLFTLASTLGTRMQQGSNN